MGMQNMANVKISYFANMKRLRRDNWMRFTIAPIVVLHWIQTKLSWKPEIDFNESKRIIWACSFVKKRQQVFALLKSIFLRNRSWVTLADFPLKEQNWEGKFVFH